MEDGKLIGVIGDEVIQQLENFSPKAPHLYVLTFIGHRRRLRSRRCRTQDCRVAELSCG